MTRPVRRKAFTLMEIIALLPILLVLVVMAYCLANDVEAIQSREALGRQEDARVRDIVRRIQEDAGRAAEATIQDSPKGRQLHLRLPGENVIYAATPTGMVRTAQSGSDPATRYNWPLDHTAIDFQLETVGAAKSPLVWILCSTKLTFDRGPACELRLSAAAAVGRGGTR